LPKNDPAVFALTAAYVEMLHDEGIAMFWPGVEPVAKYEIINLGLLESSVRQPFQSAFGEDAYPTIQDKAACLFHSLIANHCFQNGNKRTGVLALDQFAYANGYVLTIPNHDMYDLARVTASYREQGTSAKDMMTLVAGYVGENLVPYARLRNSQTKFYSRCVKWQNEIRSHPLNAEGAVTEQAKLRQGL
jgi:death-on-curing family protein